VTAHVPTEPDEHTAQRDAAGALCENASSVPESALSRSLPASIDSRPEPGIPADHGRIFACLWRVCRIASHLESAACWAELGRV
jgi:hypothetical protein